MAKEKPFVIALERQGDSNLTKIKLDVKKHADEVAHLKKRRSEINDEISAISAKVETYGIPKKAFDDAIRYFETDLDKRANYDTGYQIVREALGVQMDLFSPIDKQTDADDRRAPRPTTGDPIAAAMSSAMDAQKPSAAGDQMKDVDDAAEQEEGAKVLAKAKPAQSKVAKERLAAAGLAN
jgi:uncharacterized protein (UPF0335 family)